MHVGVKGLPIEVSSLLLPHGAWDFTLLAALVAGAFTCNVRQTVQNFIKNWKFYWKKDKYEIREMKTIWS